MRTRRFVVSSLEKVPRPLLEAEILARGVVDAVQYSPVHDALVEVWVTTAGRVRVELHQRITDDGIDSWAMIEWPSRARASLVGVRGLGMTVRSELSKFFG